MSSLSCPKASSFVYRPRRPEKTVLFEVVKKHYKTWLKRSHEPIPLHVDKVFKKYIQCGILAHGFACAHCYHCHKDFLIAFSCKGRGLCPSCNTRAMVEIAANLVENLIPPIPIRQWVISFPKRIRYYLQQDAILQNVLRIVSNEIRKKVIALRPEINNAQFGAISFIQRFGTMLNLHPHFHLIVADGVFETENESLNFHEIFLSSIDIAETEDSIRQQVLKFFLKRDIIDKEQIEKMLGYENSGFSLDATVRLEAWDREGLERLVRYCARPCFAGENLRWNGQWLIYRLPKPTHTGVTFIQLDPLDFLDRVAAFIPPPGRHRHHYHGVFAPNAPQRDMVVALANQTPKNLVSSRMQQITNKISTASLNWAQLIARIYEANPLLCTCGKEMKIRTIVTHPTKIWTILSQIGWSTEMPIFDPPYDFVDLDISQLVPGTPDGFPIIEDFCHCESGPDPPQGDSIDPPHWEDSNCIVYD